VQFICSNMHSLVPECLAYHALLKRPVYFKYRLTVRQLEQFVQYAIYINSQNGISQDKVNINKSWHEFSEVTSYNTFWKHLESFILFQVCPWKPIKDDIQTNVQWDILELEISSKLSIQIFKFLGGCMQKILF